MANGLSLESLPLEAIHQIFSFLLPPDLASLRLTSRCLRSSATSNTHWRHHFVHSLLPSYASLSDVVSVPLCAWSFSYVPNGWFRAYTTLIRVAREDWLYCDDNLKGTKWLTLFKAFLKEGGAGSDDPKFYNLIELKTDCTSGALEGLVENRALSWYVDAKSNLRFPCYPPLVPSRDPFTWCRVLQHDFVVLLADSPEFLDGLVALNSIILDEAISSKQLCAGNRDTREKELKDHIDAVLENRTGSFERLKHIHLLRSGWQESRSRGSSCSSAEPPEIAIGDVGVLEEQKKQSGYESKNNVEWNNGG